MFFFKLFEKFSLDYLLFGFYRFESTDYVLSSYPLRPWSRTFMQAKKKRVKKPSLLKRSFELNVLSIVDAYVLYADRLSYALLHAHHE